MENQRTTAIFAALGDPTRQRITELLADGRELRLSDLTEEFDLARQTVTRHLDVLCAAGVATTKWRGRERYTALSEEAFDSIRDWLGRYDRFWSGKLEELKKLIEQGEKT
jgi:DNA-binding transcriptional ArsR family regulator